MGPYSDSLFPGEQIAPPKKPTVSWEEISPESLRQAAESPVPARALGSTDESGTIGLAWFEVILGLLLGLAAMVGTWYWSNGALGLIIGVFPVLIGFPFVLTKRRDLKYLGYGLLVSVPGAFLLGILLWYLTLFI